MASEISESFLDREKIYCTTTAETTMGTADQADDSGS